MANESGLDTGVQPQAKEISDVKAIKLSQTNGGVISKREFFGLVGKGLIGGTLSGLLGLTERYFIPEIHSDLKAAVGTVKDLAAKKEGLTIEEKVENIQKEIKDLYGINVEFSGSTVVSVRAFLLERLSDMLVIYPPQLFKNLATITQKKTDAGLDYDIALPDNPILLPPTEDLVRKGYTIKFKNLPLQVAGMGHEDNIEIDKTKVLTMNFSELFAHEFGHTVHDLFGTPSLGSFSERLSPGLYIKSFQVEAIKSFPQRLFLPGFVSLYSRFNTQEDAAETFAFLLSKPKSVLATLEDREYHGELKLKLIAAMDMLYCLSGGLMDKKYFYDLAQGKVNRKYWETKQAEPYVFGKINETTVLFVTDIDKSTKGRLPAIIELTEVQNEGKPLSPFKEYNLGNLEGRTVAIKVEDDAKIGQVVNLVVDGIPLNLLDPSFLYPNEGMRIRVTLQTFSEQIAFEIENDGELLLIGGQEKRKTGNISENVLKIIDIPTKVSKTLGFVVLGAQTLNLLDEAIRSNLPPAKLKKLSAKTLLVDEVTRRDFLRRVAAAVTLAGITHYLSF